MVSNLSLLFNHNMIFRLKNSSSRQLFLIPQSYTWLCYSVNFTYCLKCKMWNEKEAYIGKTKGDNMKWFKVRINQHISDCKTGDSRCKFPRHVYNCGIKNNCLFSLNSLNIMLRLNKSDRCETIENYYHLKDYDTMNNPGRN